MITSEANPYKNSFLWSKSVCRLLAPGVIRPLTLHEQRIRGRPTNLTMLFTFNAFSYSPDCTSSALPTHIRFFSRTVTLGGQRLFILPRLITRCRKIELASSHFLIVPSRQFLLPLVKPFFGTHTLPSIIPFPYTACWLMSFNIRISFLLLL